MINKIKKITIINSDTNRKLFTIKFNTISTIPKNLDYTTVQTDDIINVKGERKRVHNKGYVCIKMELKKITYKERKISIIIKDSKAWDVYYQILTDIIEENRRLGKHE